MVEKFDLPATRYIATKIRKISYNDDKITLD